MSILDDEPPLRVVNIEAGYGRARVVGEVSLAVDAGEIVALLGPNGAGKSTLLSAVSGLLLPFAGQVMLCGKDVSRAGPRERSRAGLAHVIEGHRIFGLLSIAENLLLAGFDLRRTERERRLKQALQVFPELEERKDQPGSLLSGGQQQMLAVAQAIMRQPKVLLIDEPSAGLSPVAIDRVLAALRDLAAGGVAVLLVEQAIDKAITVADRVCVLSNGRIQIDLPARTPRLAETIEATYLGAKRHWSVH
jgi:branched-chain amino acid transport system ATP-binding protein